LQIYIIFPGFNAFLIDFTHNLRQLTYEGKSDAMPVMHAAKSNSTDLKPHPYGEIPFFLVLSLFYVNLPKSVGLYKLFL
jgi:hypothetical protein